MTRIRIDITVRWTTLVKLALLATVGATIAVGLSKGVRKRVLDALFGAQEEFEYTSTTTAYGMGAESDRTVGVVVRETEGPGGEEPPRPSARPDVG